LLALAHKVYWSISPLQPIYCQKRKSPFQ
jgi:hypothetical protein